MRNILSVDVEEYFQVEAFAGQVDRSRWNAYELRVDRNVSRVLELFARHKARATFFVLGWVARRFPGMVRAIAAEGHEIGCHGFGHQRLTQLTIEQFRTDLRAALACLTDEAQRPIRCYRAPSFSIVRSTMWALDVLAEEGFQVDSSIFPVRHDLYGVPDAPRFPYWHTTGNGNKIFEFPPSTLWIGGLNIGMGGGGYLRLAPYALTDWAISRLNSKEKQPAMIYFHPWEIDPEQPKIAAPMRSRLRHYSNLATMERKIERLLMDFRFTTLGDYADKWRVDPL